MTSSVHHTHTRTLTYHWQLYNTESSRRRLEGDAWFINDYKSACVRALGSGIFFFFTLYFDSTTFTLKLYWLCRFRLLIHTISDDFMLSIKVQMITSSTFSSCNIRVKNTHECINNYNPIYVIPTWGGILHHEYLEFCYFKYIMMLTLYFKSHICGIFEL